MENDCRRVCTSLQSSDIMAEEGKRQKLPKGHIKERERILRELRRVYIEVSNTKKLNDLDHAYKKIKQLQQGDMLPWIDIPVVPNSTLPTKKKLKKT